MDTIMYISYSHINKETIKVKTIIEQNYDTLKLILIITS